MGAKPYLLDHVVELLLALQNLDGGGADDGGHEQEPRDDGETTRHFVVEYERRENTKLLCSTQARMSRRNAKARDR